MGDKTCSVFRLKNAHMYEDLIQPSLRESGGWLLHRRSVELWEQTVLGVCLTLTEGSRLSLSLTVSEQQSEIESSVITGLCD